jgi:hypothetical protein
VSTDPGIAATFGYDGTMVAWTAAYQGRPFGCCSGKGGYEDCLEQHVTGDTGERLCCAVLCAWACECVRVHACVCRVCAVCVHPWMPRCHILAVSPSESPPPSCLPRIRAP